MRVSCVIMLTALMVIFSSELYAGNVKSSSVLYGDGVKLMREGDYAGARNIFREALQINQNDTLTHYALGRSYLYYDSNITDAIKELKEAIRCDHKYSSAYFYLGIAYMFNSEYNLAITAFKSAYEYDRGNIDILYNISISYDLMGDDFNSLYYYRRYLTEKNRSGSDFLF